MAPAAQDYLAEFRGQKRTGWIRFLEGRALRATGKMEDALEAFRGSEIAGDKRAKYETIDCLVQLGKYPEASREMNQKDDGSSRFATLQRNIHFSMLRVGFESATIIEVEYSKSAA